MVKVMTVSLDDWVVDEIIGKNKNRSSRIQELLIKGHISEQRTALHNIQTGQAGHSINPNNAEMRILSGDLWDSVLYSPCDSLEGIC